MVRGKTRDEVMVLLARQIKADRLDRESKDAEMECFAYETAVQPFVELMTAIDETIVQLLADDFEYSFPLDQRILNSSRFREEMLDIVREEFPAFIWDIKNTAHQLTYVELLDPNPPYVGWVLSCEFRTPTPAELFLLSMRVRALRAKAWLHRLLPPYST